MISELQLNRISCGMVSVLASSAEDHGLEAAIEPRSVQTKDYKIGICSFSAKHTALRGKNKGRLALNRENVFKWSDMSIR